MIHPRLTFAALSLFFLGTSLAWLWLDHSPPSWDDACYLANSLVLYGALADLTAAQPDVSAL